ncbi:MAG: hypothetical protein HZA46_24790 [Planctomycetales bacterium]|nr:hypothetical protein [Planctomycetales bacterium]
MMRSSSLALVLCSGVAWSSSISIAGEVSKTPAKPVVKRPAAAVSAATITAPQRLTGFYHPQGVGVSAASETVIDPSPAMSYSPSAMVYGPPAMPMTPVAIGSGYGPSSCGCGHQRMMWGHGTGMMIGGYGEYPSYGMIDPQSLHFGPGYHRYAMEGHVRYPYYSYRRPWYNPGHPSFNRDVNLPW